MRMSNDDTIHTSTCAALLVHWSRTFGVLQDILDHHSIPKKKEEERSNLCMEGFFRVDFFRVSSGRAGHANKPKDSAVVSLNTDD